jgi:HEAT repeat protein
LERLASGGDARFLATVPGYRPEMAARLQAAQALGTVGSKAKSQIPALRTGLKDKEPLVTYWCIWALGRMEGAAMSVVDDLNKIAGDMKQHEPIRKAAEEAVSLITGKKSTAPKGASR